MNPAFAVIIVVAVLGLWFFQRQRLNKYVADNADKNVGPLAARLGLQVLEGDPNTNLLVFQQPAGDFQRRIRLAGAPYGRPTELLLMDGQNTQDFLVAKRVTRQYSCVLHVQCQRPLPAFEIHLRTPPQYYEPDLAFRERTDLREIPTGNPQLDAMFVVRVADPRMAPALTGALYVLATHQYVHVAGDGQRIWSSMTRFGLPLFATAAEEYLLALETVACTLEGRPAPARPAVVPHAPAPMAQLGR